MPHSFGAALDDENYVVMQFTNLKDKNGKEIFEGDIVEDFQGEFFSVEYHPAAFTFNQGGVGFAATRINIDKGGFEVIGNIYETPELLK